MTAEKPRVQSNRNVILIGMPGAGKSTVGVLLAERLAYSFMDTDIYLQTLIGLRLQQIIDRQGLAGFLTIEEKVVRTINCRQHVIATGGSVVYSDAAMRHLKKNGVAVFLDLSPSVLETRLGNMAARGVVMTEGQTIGALYQQRYPLYRRHADITIDCHFLTSEQIVAGLASQIDLTC